MKNIHWRHWITALVSLVLCGSSYAQTVKSEDFTGSSSANSWYYFNGACLTAGSDSASASPGPIPGCMNIKSTYYKENLVGGQNGISGSTETLPDPAGSGALRLTNGSPGGYKQNGAIVSAFFFS